MGPKKKRNPSSHSKQPHSTPKNTTTSHQAPPEEQNTPKQLENAIIQSSCDHALAVLGQGNQIQALKLMKDTRDRHENSGLVHHTIASIHSTLAARVQGSTEYQEHLKNGSVSAKKAILLSPDSIEYLHMYVTLLFQMSSTAQDYQEVVKECKLAVAMINSTQVKSSSQEKILERFKTELTMMSGKSMMAAAMILRRSNNAESTDKEISEAPDEDDSLLTKKMDKEKKKGIGKLEERKMSTGSSSKKGGGINIDEVMEFWKRTRVEERRWLLRTRVREFKEYCDEFTSSNVLGTENFLVSGAVDYAEKSRTWKYWDCFICGHKCVQKNEFIDHISQKHLEGIPVELDDILPNDIDAGHVEKFLNGVWKPVDTAEAVRIMKDESKTPKNDQDWPLCDDLERASILETIQGKFQLVLPCSKWIAVSHLKIVMHCARGLLLNNDIVSKSKIQIHGLDKTPICVRLLGASTLTLILRLVQELHSEMTTIADKFNVKNEYEAKERIGLFSDGTLCLMLEENLQRREEHKPSAYLDSIADYSTAKTSAVSDNEVDSMAESDAIVSQLFMDFKIEETLVSWQRLQIVKGLHGMEIYMNIVGNTSDIENLCTKRYNQFVRNKTLLSIQIIWTEELVKRGQGTSYTPQTYESLFEKRQEELVGKDNVSDIDELYVIQRIIVDDVAEAKKIYEDDADQGDKQIREFIECLLNLTLLEISKIEGDILKTYACIQHLFLQLTKVAVHDYRMIVSPILQSFMQEKLEDWAHKYATEKADAASKALLAELESDADTNLRKGCNQMKHEGKSSDKKKKRNYRKHNKETEATGDKLKDLQQETGKMQQETEKMQQETDKMQQEIDKMQQETDKEEDIDSEMLHLEEELRHKLDLDEEERMLEEHLERQRQIENEGTQRQLADLNITADGTLPEVAETFVSATGALQEEGNDPGASSIDVAVENMDESYILFGSYRCSLSNVTGQNMDASNN